MIKKYYILIYLVAVFGLLGCGERENRISPSGNSIKIGVIGPFSGSRQVLAENTVEGIRTVLHMHPYLNNGDKIELIIENDQNNPEETIKVFKKLVNKDKVSAVILISTSASALAINSIVDTHKVPVLALLATHPEIGKETHFISQLSIDNIFQGMVAALFVRDELLIEKVAVFKNSDSFHSASLAEAFVKKFRSIEGQINKIVPVTSKTTDYKNILSQLQQQQVELLYLPVDAQIVLEITKQLDEMGWAPKLMGGDGLLSNILTRNREYNNILDGVMAIDIYSNDTELTPSGKQTRKVFSSLFDTKNRFYPALGIEGMAVLMTAINRCSSTADGICINKKIHEIEDFEGLLGQITIQPSGKVLRPLYINRIQGNQLKFIVKVY